MTKQEMIEEIENAYTWEGSAHASIRTESVDSLVLSISGSSTVEHSGDTDEIEDQVSDLRGKSFKIDGVWHEITQAVCRIIEEPHGDSDYEVDVNGTVTIKKRKE